MTDTLTNVQPFLPGDLEHLRQLVRQEFAQGLEFLTLANLDRAFVHKREGQLFYASGDQFLPGFMGEGLHLIANSGRDSQLVLSGTAGKVLHTETHFLKIVDDDFVFVTTGLGAANTQKAFATADTSVVGVLQSETGSTATGAAGFQLACDMALHSGIWTYKTRIRIPTLSTGTQRFTVQSGFTNIFTTTAFNQGAGFIYRDDLNGGRWLCQYGNTGSVTSTDSAQSVTANTWYTLCVSLDKRRTSNQLQFFINGTRVAQATVTFASGTSTVRAGGSIVKSVGTTSLTVDYDYAVLRGYLDGNT